MERTLNAKTNAAAVSLADDVARRRLADAYERVTAVQQTLGIAGRKSVSFENTFARVGEWRAVAIDRQRRQLLAKELVCDIWDVLFSVHTKTPLQDEFVGFPPCPSVSLPATLTLIYK